MAGSCRTTPFAEAKQSSSTTAPILLALKAAAIAINDALQSPARDPLAKETGHDISIAANGAITRPGIQRLENKLLMSIDQSPGLIVHVTKAKAANRTKVQKIAIESAILNIMIRGDLSA